MVNPILKKKWKKKIRVKCVKLCTDKEKEKFFRLHNLGHSLILAMQGVSKVHSDLFASSVSLNSYFTYLSKN